MDSWLGDPKQESDEGSFRTFGLNGVSLNGIPLSINEVSWHSHEIKVVPRTLRPYVSEDEGFLFLHRRGQNERKLTKEL